MRVDESQWARLQFLARVTHKECQYLLETDQRPSSMSCLCVCADDTAKRVTTQIDKLAPKVSP